MNLSYDTLEVVSGIRMGSSKLFSGPSYRTTFIYASESSIDLLNLSGAVVHPVLIWMTLVSVTW